MKGRNAIITNAICHPLISANITPLMPILNFVRTEVTLFISPWCTLPISMYILEQTSAGRLRSCQAIYWFINDAKYAFLAFIICLSLVIDHAADINHEFTNTIALFITKSLTESNASFTIYWLSLPGANAFTSLPKG